MSWDLTFKYRELTGYRWIGTLWQNIMYRIRTRKWQSWQKTKKSFRVNICGRAWLVMLSNTRRGEKYTTFSLSSCSALIWYLHFTITDKQSKSSPANGHLTLQSRFCNLSSTPQISHIRSSHYNLAFHTALVVHQVQSESYLFEGVEWRVCQAAKNQWTMQEESPMNWIEINVILWQMSSTLTGLTRE